MPDVLLEHLSRKITLSPAEYAILRQEFIPRHLRRREVVQNIGEPARYAMFVEHGALRAFSHDDKGIEQTTQFTFEGGWISDRYSMLTGEPATLTIEALEDSDVLLLDSAASERIYAQVPKFERYQRLLLQNHLVVVYRRLLNTLSASAEAKYDALVAAQPAVVQRVSQKLVASYLGITPESLSRIRARKAGRS